MGTSTESSLMRSSLALQQPHPTEHVVVLLQIATAGRGDYFGEQSVCSKVPKSSTSVIAASCVSVLLLHKWDVLNSVETSLLAELPRYSVVGSINDELLVEQFYR